MPTQEEFTAAMKAAVEERGPGWVYPQEKPSNGGWFYADGVSTGCRYRLEDGSPACIVGLALSKLGLLDELDENDEGRNAGEVLLALSFPDSVAMAANAAQSRQDIGRSWGAVLDTYLDSLRDVA